MQTTIDNNFLMNIFFAKEGWQKLYQLPYREMDLRNKEMKRSCVTEILKDAAKFHKEFLCGSLCTLRATLWN